jgi:hypothetical protein
MGGWWRFNGDIAHIHSYPLCLMWISRDMRGISHRFNDETMGYFMGYEVSHATQKGISHLQQIRKNFFQIFKIPKKREIYQALSSYQKDGCFCSQSIQIGLSCLSKTNGDGLRSAICSIYLGL